MKKEEGLYAGKGKATLIYENRKKKHNVFEELTRRGSSSRDLKPLPYKSIGNAVLQLSVWRKTNRGEFLYILLKTAREMYLYLMDCESEAQKDYSGPEFSLLKCVLWFSLKK